MRLAPMKAILDAIKWAAIVAVWGGVTVWLWGMAFWVALLWIIPGFILVMNLVGFALLPVYMAVVTHSAEVKALRELENRYSKKP